MEQQQVQNGRATNTLVWRKKILIRALLHVVLCLGVSRMVVDGALTMYLHYGYCETRHRQQCRLPRHPQDRYNFDSCWRYTADIRQGV